MRYLPVVKGEFGLPTVVGRTTETSRSESKQQGWPQRLKDYEYARRHAGGAEVIRRKYHSPKLVCPIHRLQHTAHPLSIMCLHPDCISDLLAKTAIRQKQFPRMRNLKRLGLWDDFVSTVLVWMVSRVRNDPFSHPWLDFHNLPHRFHQSYHTAARPAQDAGYELPTESLTIQDLTEQETDAMLDTVDNIHTRIMLNQARQRFGNDLHILCLAGELTPMDVARVEAPQDHQIERALLHRDVMRHERHWWCQQFDREVPDAT